MEEKWDESNPEWLHKENFLCAFTAPQLFSQFLALYKIVGNRGESSRGIIPCDTLNQEEKEPTQRLLTIKSRSTNKVVLGPVDLSTARGRERVATFFGKHHGTGDVVCVTAASSNNNSHTHQFGNTSSGVKARGDTRTVHIVNAATVRELSETLQLPLFRPAFDPTLLWKDWSRGKSSNGWERNLLVGIQN